MFFVTTSTKRIQETSQKLMGESLEVDSPAMDEDPSPCEFDRYVELMNCLLDTYDKEGRSATYWNYEKQLLVEGQRITKNGDKRRLYDYLIATNMLEKNNRVFELWESE